MKKNKMTKEEFEQILCQELSDQGIDITDNQLEQLFEYKELLIEWNEKVNLTAITDDYEIIIKHFVDSLECTKVITDDMISFIDVGTGAGFPGIPLSIYYPQKEFTLLDALNKRINFLDEVVKKLGLNNVKLVHARAEEYIRQTDTYETFDASLSRAVANLPILTEYVTPYVKTNGISIIMKGDNVNEEIIMSSNAFKVLNLKVKDKFDYSYKIDDEEYKRTIVLIQKTNDTPSKYPRNYGQMKKKPL